MGSSYVEYRGHGFWSRDQFIEQLAGEIAEAMDRETNKQDWQNDLVKHWREQASGNFSGWVHLRLDDFLISEERRLKVRELTQRIINQRVLADPVHRTGVLLLQLFDGELATDAGSPLDYMVGQSEKLQGE